MTGIGTKPDIQHGERHVRFVPRTDIRNASQSFENAVSVGEPASSVRVKRHGRRLGQCPPCRQSSHPNSLKQVRYNPDFAAYWRRHGETKPPRGGSSSHLPFDGYDTFLWINFIGSPFAGRSVMR